MRCFKPLPVWDYDGPITFRPPKNEPYMKPSHSVRCRKCIGCAKTEAQGLSLQIIHESYLHTENSVVTLTYSNEFLKDPRLQKKDVKNFLNRLRRRYPKVRYFAAGEYGSKNYRPHFHVILFGFIPPDIDLINKSTLIIKNKSEQHLSEFISSIWPYGFSTVGVFTDDSAVYCSGYVTKKLSDKQKNIFRFVKQNNFYYVLPPEFRQKSDNLGIEWFKRHYKEIMNIGHITLSDGSGYTYPIPRFYLTKLKEFDPDCYEEYKQKKIKEFENDTNTESMMFKKEPEKYYKILSYLEHIKEYRNSQIERKTL